GYTVRDVAKGSWIDESTVTLPKAPPLNTLPRATKVPEPQPPQEDYTFEGYRNADGSVGTKNLLGITTSVHCMPTTITVFRQQVAFDNFNHVVLNVCHAVH
ncbi:UxaA family hydrolase, partial [Escherichia coli]|uniref:UxaA family hydrolase n=1 Tax=Escherichia coli TaxID=562 RepID=UPI001BC8B9FF